MAKPVDLSKYLGNDSDDGNTLFEQFSNSIIDGLSRRLQKRKFVLPTNEDDSLCTNQEHNNSVVLDKNNENLHDEVAAVIQEGLEFLLCVLAWKICGVQKKHNLIVENENDLLKDTDGCEDETIDDTVLILRNKLMLLLEMCFEQFVDSDLNICCMAQVKFADTVQKCACLCASDMRSLCPKE